MDCARKEGTFVQIRKLIEMCQKLWKPDNMTRTVAFAISRKGKLRAPMQTYQSIAGQEN